MHYVALIDGAEGSYGAHFPDLPGCTAMGGSVDEVIENAGEALRAWVETVASSGADIPAARSLGEIVTDADVQEELAEGSILASILLIRDLGRPVKANMSIDSGVLAAIDATAERLGVTRSALVERMATERLPAYA
jgi:predicted RNase H-like HicB family nuclease